jgi:single-strand DNA-binding protein
MSPNRLPNLNKVLIVGFLTRDPELRRTSSDIPVVNFRIACSKRHRDAGGSIKDDVCHIGVVAWQKLAESCGSYLKKGDAVMIEGELKSRIRNEANGFRRSFVEIRAQHIQFLNRQGDLVSLNDGNENAEAIGLANAESFRPNGESALSEAVGSDDEQAYDYEENTL